MLQRMLIVNELATWTSSTSEFKVISAQSKVELKKKRLAQAKEAEGAERADFDEGTACEVPHENFPLVVVNKILCVEERPQGVLEYLPAPVSGLRPDGVHYL